MKTDIELELEEAVHTLERSQTQAAVALSDLMKATSLDDYNRLQAIRIRADKEFQAALRKVDELIIRYGMTLIPKISV